MYKCTLCGEKKNIVLWEYLGAYDGWQAIQCDNCGKKSHRNGLEILAEIQGEHYGPAYFILKQKDGTHIRYKNLFPYSKFNLEEDKIFEELEKSIT